jgi:hypothetical protein
MIATTLRSRPWLGRCLAGALLIAGAGMPACTPLRTTSVAAQTTEQKFEAAELLRTALDGEALYTIAGGLKPLSTGFWSDAISLEEPDLEAFEAARAALRSIERAFDGELAADVAPFAAEHDGERRLEAHVVHRRAFADAISANSDAFHRFGITASTDPGTALAIVERLPRADRWRAYGILFGYPRDAVEFFVAAGERARETGSEVGPGKDRSFVSIPTFARAEGGFTWAVPLDHAPSPAEDAIRAAASAILADYTLIRDRIQRLDDAASIAAALEPLRSLDHRRTRHAVHDHR